MNIEEFALGHSIVHKMDPRARILAALVFSVVTALIHSLWAAALASVFPAVLILAARISIRGVMSRLAVVNTFILFLWLFLPFTSQGEIVYAFGPLKVHDEGLRLALLMTLKSNAIVMALIALLATCPVVNLVHALSHLGVPDKLVHLFFFCFRYLHVIHDEYHRLANAMKIRGFRPRTDIHTYRSVAHLVGMLLVRSFDRSSRILDAMKCRGFKGRFYILGHYEMKPRDYCVAASSMIFSALLLVVR
ncbi:MAG: cobalt ECF transporter T component CbiQ [Pseudomonadota bacterium]